MKRKIIAVASVFLLNLNNGIAEDSLPLRNAKEIHLKYLLTLSNTEAYQAIGIFDRGVVMKDGVKYRRFESSYGSIIILDTGKLSRHDIERAQCVPGMAPGASQTSDSAFAQAEAKMGVEGDWTGYAAMIQQTIKSKCDGSVPIAVDVNLSFR